MSETTGWMDAAFKEIYETELIGLERRWENEKNCSIEQLKGTLKNLYIFQGNNWDGRGHIYELSLSATIAAHEFFIDEKEKELNSTTS